MNKKADIADALKDPKLMSTVLGLGGAGALAGGALSYANHDPNETPQQRRHRILRNALLAGGMGAGAGALGYAGANQLNTALPAGETDPVSRMGKSMPVRLGLGTATAAGMTAAIPGLRNSQANARSNILDRIQDEQRNAGNHTGMMDELRHLSGKTEAGGLGLTGDRLAKARSDLFQRTVNQGSAGRSQLRDLLTAGGVPGRSEADIAHAMHAAGISAHTAGEIGNSVGKKLTSVGAGHLARIPLLGPALDRGIQGMGTKLMDTAKHPLLDKTLTKGMDMGANVTHQVAGGRSSIAGTRDMNFLSSPKLRTAAVLASMAAPELMRAGGAAYRGISPSN